MPRVARRPAAAPAQAEASRIANARLRASSSVVDRPSARALLIRRLRRLTRPAIGAFLLVLLLFAASLAVRDAGSGGSTGFVRRMIGDIGASMGLTVENIVIDGRENTPEPLLRRALGVMIGQPILGFSLNDARNRLLALGWVSDAVVERRLPNTLVVRLVERAPFAVWQDHGTFRLIDRSGAVMGEQDVARAAEALNLPLVVGDGAPDAATELFDEMKPYADIRKRLVGAVRVGQERWNLVLKSGATVMLPGESQEDALARLQALQQRMRILDRPLHDIDLRLADRVVVRPLPKAAPPTLSGSAAAPAPPPHG